jgi:hypothetical protein
MLQTLGAELASNPEHFVVDQANDFVALSREIYKIERTIQIINWRTGTLTPVRDRASRKRQYD